MSQPSGKFLKIEFENGESLVMPASFQAGTVRIEPFTYSDLLAHLELKVATKPGGSKEKVQQEFLLLRGSTKSAQITSTEGGVKKTKVFAEPLSFSAKLHRNKNRKAFALVKGGWLPAELTDSDLFLFDSNVAGRFSSSKDKAIDLNSEAYDWLQAILFTKAHVNLSLCALEGGSQRHQSLSEFLARWIELNKKAQSCLGVEGELAGIVQASKEAALANFSIMLSFREQYSSHSALMRKASSFRNEKMSPDEKEAALKELGETSESLGVSKGSVIFSLIEDYILNLSPYNGFKGPGEGVFKFRKGISEESTYNALFDVFQLTLLFTVTALEAHLGKIALYTQDRGLALAWCYLNEKSISRRT